MIENCFSGFAPGDLPPGVPLYSGKVRDVLDLGDRLLITVTDRISAFDRVLSTIPFKGEVLSRISAGWFALTGDIIPNHVVEALSPRTTVVRKAEVLPVEVVVRGHLTGSAWRDYQAGRPVSGIRLPGGMRKNQAFDRPLLTPSTKAGAGEHDEPVSEEEIVRRGLVPAELWEKVRFAALALFRRGREISRSRGLILVDTKYEFGLLPDGGLILVDEIHTPDSSRYWHADSWDGKSQSGEEPRGLDKEYFRGWLLERGYSGDGAPPQIPDEVRLEVSRRYIEAFEAVSGEKFVPSAGDGEAEKKIILSYIAEHRG